MKTVSGTNEAIEKVGDELIRLEERIKALEERIGVLEVGHLDSEVNIGRVVDNGSYLEGKVNDLEGRVYDLESSR